MMTILFAQVMYGTNVETIERAKIQEKFIL